VALRINDEGILSEESTNWIPNMYSINLSREGCSHITQKRVVHQLWIHGVQFGATAP